MTDLDALLAGIVANPHEAVRWLIVADWLDDHGFADRAELLRLHRMLIDTCCQPDRYPDRAAWQARIVELIDRGVKPCVPQHTLLLPGGGPLVGNFIPPGSFLMGSEDRSEEKPIHRVTITKGFFLGIYPVTQAQWRAVMGTDPSKFKGDNRPVESVNRNEAVVFCESAMASAGVPVRLPTEAEWEYACRAGTTTRFYFGDSPSPARMWYDQYMNWYFGEMGELEDQVTEVGKFAPNGWGLFDCHGNVEEACSDYFNPGFYTISPPQDPMCPAKYSSVFVHRGGHGGTTPEYATSASRAGFPPMYSSDCHGFRVAFTLS